MADSINLPVDQSPVSVRIKEEFDEVPPASCPKSRELRIKSEQFKNEEEQLEIMTCRPDRVLRKTRHTYIKADMDHLPNVDSVQDANPLLIENDKPKSRTKFECKQCGLIFGRKDGFLVHTYIHTGEKPYSCSICNKGFSRADGLAVHVRYHTGERPYKCRQCGRNFTTSSNLKEHKFTHAEGIKPYACQDCDKSFGHPNDLAKHIRTHTGERPYPCTHCGLAFRRSETLRKHVFRKHESKAAFPCANCTKVYKTEGLLEKHIRSHCNKDKQQRESRDA